MKVVSQNTSSILLLAKNCVILILNFEWIRINARSVRYLCASVSSMYYFVHKGETLQSFLILAQVSLQLEQLIPIPRSALDSYPKLSLLNSRLSVSLSLSLALSLSHTRKLSFLSKVTIWRSAWVCQLAHLSFLLQFVSFNLLMKICCQVEWNWSNEDIRTDLLLTTVQIWLFLLRRNSHCFQFRLLHLLWRKAEKVLVISMFQPKTSSQIDFVPLSI